MIAYTEFNLQIVRVESNQEKKVTQLGIVVNKTGP